MGLRQGVHRLAVAIERLADRYVARRARGRPIVEPYIGYATPEALILRGRVLTALRRHEPLPQQGWWTNLRQMLSLFLTSEVEGVRLLAEDGSGRPREAVSDAEGYFTILLPRAGRAPGWHEVPVTVAGWDHPVPCPVLIPDPAARTGTISDIDDTLIRTGAYSLLRNLWTSLTGNALTRHAFPDAARLLAARAAAGPVFYVSSSPWNLHRFLQDVFVRAGLPRGPVFLRDLGLVRAEGAAGGGHLGHKGAAVDALMAANPGLAFWLVGDTGQRDAEVYLAAARRHPGRVARVVLREPRRWPGRPGPSARAAMEALRAMGVPLTAGRDFGALL